MDAKALLERIDAYLAQDAINITETTFGRMAVNDGKFVPDLRSGRRVWPETAEKVLTFIKDHPGPLGPGSAAILAQNASTGPEPDRAA